MNRLRIFDSFNISSVYSSWGSYSQCSKTCGDGEKTRARTCIGGICSRATTQDLIQTDVCKERNCEFILKKRRFKGDMSKWGFKVHQSFRYGVPGQVVAKHVVTERKQEAEVVVHIVTMFLRMINQKMETVMRVTVSNWFKIIENGCRNRKLFHQIRLRVNFKIG